MTAVVFVGPTLTSDVVAEHLDATILPPVRQGDVYRVAREKPTAIGIIDGFFEGVPSVWHKEILWAIEQGIPVFGSASMGALRAAELADFGMIGVGQIFQDYYDDVLQDDDEVAVLHSPAELGFQPLSEPMVSIRATVAQAEAAGVLSPDTASEVLQRAKALHYRQRIWADIIAAALDLPGVSDFSDWLPTGRIDAKADDARAMLAQMSKHLAQTPHPPPQATRTEPTLMWKALRARVDAGEPSTDRAIVDELRLNPDLYAQLKDRAALALLSREDAFRRDRTPARADLVRQMDGHRAATGLSRRSDLMAWIEANDLNPESYEAMLADAARIDAAVASRASYLDTQLLSELRRAGQYTQLRDRAANKGQSAIPAGASGVDRLRVLMWYFESRLDQEVPDDLDSYAVALGLAGRDAFYDLIEAEFLYCHKGADTGAAE
ncbi:TfuA-like protein [Ruegeria sp. ANG10]|uniref:TfuA-like protein n=1 Tax=Ruegeria sp. ANG10 TaxID=3042467 RepID=UPI0034513582